MNVSPSLNPGEVKFNEKLAFMTQKGICNFKGHLVAVKDSNGSLELKLITNFFQALFIKKNEELLQEATTQFFAKNAKFINDSNLNLVKQLADRAGLNPNEVNQLRSSAAPQRRHQGIYEEMKGDLQKLGSLEKKTKEGAQANLFAFSQYATYLQDALSSYPNKQTPLSSSDLKKIQLKFKTITSHLDRIKQPTPEKVEKYIKRHLELIEGLYKQAKAEGNLEIFYKGIAQSFGCFEDRIAGCVEYIEEEMGKINGQNNDFKLVDSRTILGDFYEKYIEKGIKEDPKFEGTSEGFKSFIGANEFSKIGKEAFDSYWKYVNGE